MIMRSQAICAFQPEYVFRVDDHELIPRAIFFIDRQDTKLGALGAFSNP